MGSLSSRQFWMKVKEEYKLSLELNELIQSYDVDKEISMYHKVGLISGVVNVLKMLKENNIRIALATSASKKRMNAVIDMFELRYYFDQCVCDSDVKKSKPDPEVFLLAAKKLNVDPKLCIVIEDSHNGLLSAQSAGMKCIGYKGLDHVNENMIGADLQITNFNQLNLEKLKELV